MTWIIVLACVITNITVAWPLLCRAGEQLGWVIYDAAMAGHCRHDCGVCQAFAADRDRRLAEALVTAGDRSLDVSAQLSDS